ncbi:MAG: hypothetical protein MI749_02855 [Desulfovibrionales bacterium]|nr:hypothetical protein [Desulfovibrionales bacterium]
MISFNPNRTLQHHLLLTLIILSNLHKTRTGIKNLTADRICLYHFLLSNPSILNKLLYKLNKKKKHLEYHEQTLLPSLTVAQLFKDPRISISLSLLKQNDALLTEYSERFGLIYTPNAKGQNYLAQIETQYSKRLIAHAEQLGQLKSQKLGPLKYTLAQVL